MSGFSGGWFKSIKLPSAKKRLNNVVKLHLKRYGEVRLDRIQPARKTIHIASALSNAKWGRNVLVGDMQLRIYSLTELSKMLGYKSHSEIRNWYNKKFLPEPFLTRQYGETVNVYYTSDQVRCIIKVVNDVFSQGYSKLPLSSLDDHKKMLHIGSALAMKKLDNIDRGAYRRAFGGEFGVRWIS